MKILVLGSRIPYPQRDGGAIATWGMLKAMAACGADVTYFSFNTKKHFVPEAEIQKQFNFCRVIPVYLDATPTAAGALMALLSGKNYNMQRFYSEKANQNLAELLQKETFDIVHFESLFTVPFYHVVSQLSNAPKVLRQHNVEYRIWENLQKNTSNPVKKWYLKSLVNTLRKYEMDAIRKFKNIVSITAEDGIYFKEVNPSAAHFLYPAGIEVKPLSGHSDPKPHTLCHLGSMEWMPNQEAVLWFIQQIWPSIHSQYPDAEFHIAGKGLDKNAMEYRSSGVINHGEVENAEGFMRSCCAVAVPLLSGSGLRMKTIGAMALGLPVISSSLGASGINCTPGKDILIADDLTAWNQAVKTVFEDPTATKNIGEAAKKMVTENYSVTILTEKLLDFYRSLLLTAGKD